MFLPLRQLRYRRRFPQVVRTQKYSAPMAGWIPASKQRFVPRNGTYPKGFVASGTHVGVKPSNTSKPDLALIVSQLPCSAAAEFTQNEFPAAPVVISRQTLQATSGTDVQAVVINADCANAITGKKGVEDAAAMKTAVEDCLAGQADGTRGGRSLVMSTGIIGQRLPIQKIVCRIPLTYSHLSSDHASWLSAATAMCTTDTFPKLACHEFQLPSSPGKTYRLAGLTKGSGMIHPNMATLLTVLCTDAPIAAEALRPLLMHAMTRSFHKISVDGDTSTNDTVALLANGAAGGPTITADGSTTKNHDYHAFQSILTSFVADLAKLVVWDGEGATKFITIRILAAPSQAAAHAIASSIARSPLVKTALYGKDANWGRIMCAIGNTSLLPPGTIRAEETSLSFAARDGTPELKLCVNGEPETLEEERAKEILDQDELEILVKLRQGDGGEEACFYTCDLGHGYVTINGDYRS